jgi:hypothetical protein
MLGLIGRWLLDDREGIRDINTLLTGESPSLLSQSLQQSWVVLQLSRAVRFPKQAQVAVERTYPKIDGGHAPPRQRHYCPPQHIGVLVRLPGSLYRLVLNQSICPPRQRLQSPSSLQRSHLQI